MWFNFVMIIGFLIKIIVPYQSYAGAIFIPTKKSLKPYYENPNLVMIASTGRSGSTMLTTQVSKYIPEHYVLKTHLLPPKREYFKGKILFVFSNPDQAAESVLYMMLHKPNFGRRHFKHVETSDRRWLKKIKSPYKYQTEKNNLLSYDALGIYKHLKVWLYTRTRPTSPEKAHILAVKYENLWDTDVIQAIRDYLEIPSFELPARIPRGHKDLLPKEARFRQIYNLGTKENPRYAAYDKARVLWQQAPSFQYLEIADLTAN